MTSKRFWKIFLRVTVILLLLLLVSAIALMLALKSPKVQTFVAQKITSALSEKLETKIDIGKVEITFFNRVYIENFYIEDRRPDTLVHIGSLEATFSYFQLFKKNISLNNLKVNNVLVHLHKSSGDLEYNFEKIFKLSIPENETTISSNEWKLKLNDIDLNNIRFLITDSLSGSLIDINTPKIAVNYKKFNIDNLSMDLSYFDLKDPSISIQKFQACFTKEPEPFSLNLPIRINGERFNVENGFFEFINHLDTNDYKNKFAPNYIQLNEINLQVNNISVFSDSIFSSINNLSFNEKSGFSIKKIKTDLELSNQVFSLQNLSLETRKSYIGDGVELKYSSFDDFRNFIEDVRIESSFKKTRIDPKDILYFTDLKDINLNTPIYLDGEISGTINNIRSRDISIKIGKRTNFNGSLSLMGLPNIKQTFISFRVDKLVTDYQDVINIYNKIPFENNFKKLGRVNFNGRFDGFVTDFVAYGKLATELGVVDLDVNFKITEKQEAFYTGIFHMKQFNIGTFLGKDELLGLVTLNGNITGKGLKINTLEAKITGKIESISLKKYEYKNIDVDGDFKDRFFKGSAKVNDEFLKMTFDGLVDAREKIPFFNFKADIKEIHLAPLNILKKPLIISSKLETDFSASSLNNVLGKLNVRNTEIKFKEKTYFIEKVDINSNELYNKDKQITITSDNINANIRGNFTFTELPDAIQKIVLPNFNKKVVDQIIKFDVTLNDDNELLSLFVPDLKLVKDATISGNLNTKSESLLAIINVPFVQYGKISALKFNSNIFINKENVNVINSIPTVYLGDSIFLENITLLANGERKDLNLKLNVYTPNNNSSANLQANLLTNNSSSTLKFKNSKLLLNNSYWNINEKNLITFGKKSIVSENFQITNADSELRLDIEFDEKTKDIQALLKNINLYDYTGFFRRKGIDINGVANGNFSVNLIEDIPSFLGNLSVSDIEINKYKVGNFSANGVLDLPNKKIKVLGALTGKDNDVRISGNYSIAPESTNKDLDINIKINKFSIRSIDHFISEYIEDSDGYVSGNLRLVGPKKKPDLLGFVDIEDVTTTVTFLKTRYNVKNQKITFDKNVINLGSRLKLTDIEGNAAFGNGKLTHNNFKNLALDIKVTSERIIGLNTTSADNETFYGKAYLKGGVNFTGPVNDINIYVYGESEPASNIEILLGESGGANNYEFYSFVEKNVDEDELLIRGNKPLVAKIKGLTVKLDLILDQDLGISIILDQAAGDVLRAKGNGNITIDVIKGGEEVNFFGNYVIADGDYLFTLQNIINKRFRIQPNSSIQFNGPIEQATVNLEAVYSIRSSTYTLIQEFLDPSNATEISYANNRVPIKLYLLLSESLYNPKIGFDIKIEQIDPSIRNYVEGKLQSIQNYENELNRQVFGLLVLNQFLPFTGGLDNQFNSQTTISGSAANTVSEFLSNQLSRYFNDWLSYIADDLDLSINYRNYDQNTGDAIGDEAFLERRRELQLALSKRFLDDRITINVGGNVDFGQENIQNEAGNTFFGGDFSVEYAFTKSRRFRMKAFTTSDYDYFSQSNRTRAGVGVSYRKEFDGLKENKNSIFNKNTIKK